MQECYPHKQGKAAGADSIYCGQWTILDGNLLKFKLGANFK